MSLNDCDGVGSCTLTAHHKGTCTVGPWPNLTGYTGECLACAIEADIGTEETPHPVPPEFHTCERAA